MSENFIEIKNNIYRFVKKHLTPGKMPKKYNSFLIKVNISIKKSISLIYTPSVVAS